MENLGSPVIRHTTITRFRVLKGQFALAWEENQPTFFEGIFFIYFLSSFPFVFSLLVTEIRKRGHLRKGFSQLHLRPMREH